MEDTVAGGSDDFFDKMVETDGEFNYTGTVSKIYKVSLKLKVIVW